MSIPFINIKEELSDDKTEPYDSGRVNIASDRSNVRHLPR